MANHADSMDRMGRTVALAIFVAMVVDGMNIQLLALALPSISAELKLSSLMAGLLGTFTLLGMGIGGIAAGWLSDRVGRVRVVWWSVVVFSVCTTLVAGCQHYWQIAVMRFLSGLGIAGLYGVGTLLVTEFVPTRRRTTVLGILQAGWSVGYVISALASSFIIPAWGWRSLFLSTLLPGVLALVMLRGVTDPPSWLAVRRAAAAKGRAANEFSVMWADVTIRRTLILWSLTAIALQFSYFGANTWLPSYLVSDLGVDLKNMGWYVAATYAMMTVGKVLTGYLGDLLGRRITWAVAGLATAVYLPLLVHFATSENVPYLLLAFGFLYGAPFAINATYLSESFPASIRGTAVSTAFNMGRIGAMVSPVMIGSAASRYSIGAGLALLAVSYVLCALVPALFIPEKMYDPKAVETASARVGAAEADSAKVARRPGGMSV